MKLFAYLLGSAAIGAAGAIGYKRSPRVRKAVDRAETVAIRGMKSTLDALARAKANLASELLQPTDEIDRSKG